MARFKFSIDGIFEWGGDEKIIFEPGSKFRVSAEVSGELDSHEKVKIDSSSIKLEKSENTESKNGAAVSLISIPDNFTSTYLTLEQFGGKPYYKLINSGLEYSGRTIRSKEPVFSMEDVGKTFCGLFAHQNPVLPEDDSFFPGIIGSRYSSVTRVIDPYQIEVSFEFNGSSEKGYIFFDNSLPFKAAIDAVKSHPTHTIELQGGCTYVIPEFEKMDLTSDFYLFAKQRTNLKIGLEDYFNISSKKNKKQSGFLFDIGGRSLTVGIVNVNFVPPFRRIPAAQVFATSLFRSIPEKSQQAKVAIINMDTTVEIKESDLRYNQVGFGFGFFYSSEKGNFIIGKNIKHRGPGFMDFKANFGGGLFAVFENIQTDFKNEESFASPRIKVKGILQDNTFTITSGQTIYQIYTYDFGAGNVAHILHLARYTFIIDGPGAVLNASKLKLRPYADGLTRLKIRDKRSVYAKNHELHAGDELILSNQSYRIIEKTRTYVTEWAEGDADVKYAMILKLDKDLPMSEGFETFEVKSIGKSLFDGKEVDAYLIYKANSEFRSYPNTNFGDREILSSNPVGHLSYNHKEITLWAKDFKHNGFYRQSLSNVGQSNGYTLINCEGFHGQFSPDSEVKNTGPMPEEARVFISELERRFS